MMEKPAPPTPPTTIRHRWRFAVVLAAALLLAVAQPLTAGLFDEEGSFDVFFSLLIAAVVLLVFEEKEHRKIALSLGLAAFVGIWLGHGLGGRVGHATLLGAHLVAACFFAFALFGILRGIFAKQVSGDAIFGAVCGYLLLAIIWSVLYSALETASPGSFSMPSPSSAEVAAGRLDRSALSYYSFITLATVGYGDVTPVTRLARTLAWMEAITGQFYLAILVAGLVGFKVTQAMGKPPDGLS
jgi:voltage-gated potassium channel